MEIKEAHIHEAEQLLLRGHGTFDEERINFIKNLDSIDLLAVPGSGKTTALNAKLYCMSKQLPMADGSGILVISHTNAAIDEIKHNLSSCSDLFDYPNFVGTIQDFVDSFLALPYYYGLYKKKVDCVDDERYAEAWNKILQAQRANGFKRELLCTPFNPHLNYDENGDYISESVKGDRVQFGDYRCWGGMEEGDKEKRKEAYYSFLLNVKQKLLERGILHYDDCYYLANKYIWSYPEIIDVIRKRFRYVFVDEAQDMYDYQLEIIDKLFHHEDVILQRVGDPNQSIYSSNGEDCEWIPRNPIYIKNSLRLNQTIGRAVNRLVLDRGNAGNGDPAFVVNGIREIDIDIPPVLILYDDQTENQLKQKFKELIREYNLSNVSQAKYGFHIIGWNGTPSEAQNSRRLQDIFPEYKKDIASQKQTYNSLNEYINSYGANTDFKTAKKVCLLAICRASTLASVKNQEGRNLNVTSLKSFVEKISENNGVLLEGKILECCKFLTKGDKLNAYNSIKAFLTDSFLQLFGVEVTESVQTFLGENFIPVVIQEGHHEEEDDDIVIGTVHSVKGMTHCATMYVETYNNRKYESQRLLIVEAHGRRPYRIEERKSALWTEDMSYNLDKQLKQTLKIMYVGFSRPTHLLCYASDIGRWDNQDIQSMERIGWRILNISQQEIQRGNPLF